MYESISLSPDGQHLLATRIERPFSYITSYGGFPRATVVLDRNGSEVAELDYRPLNEGGGFGRGGGGGGPRAFAWLPDGSGLGYLERAERDEDDPDAPRPDRLMRVSAPFDFDDGEVLAESEDPIQSVTYSLDGDHAFATVSKDGDDGIAYWRLGSASPTRRMLVDFYDTSDPTTLQGDLATVRPGTASPTPWFRMMGSTYLTGPGYKEDFRPQPFVDRLSLSDGSTERLFEGATDSFDRPLVLLDPDAERMIVSRESMTDFPDSFLWEGGSWENLTNNVDPFPEVTAAQRMDFEFERRDGLKVHGRVSLPVGYVEGEKVPAIFWTYPREYERPELYQNAVVRSRNKNAFTHMSWLRWSDLWLTQGYALVYPEIPIIGENYNDTYIGNLVDAMYGAIRAVDASGRYRHRPDRSWGTQLRSLRHRQHPGQRSLLQSRHRRGRGVQPLPHAIRIPGRASDHLGGPPHLHRDVTLLQGRPDRHAHCSCITGATTTTPVPSRSRARRMIHALTELGKTAVLYEYPFESHTPRAIENKFDMWARFIGWFDEWVKGEG